MACLVTVAGPDGDKVIPLGKGVTVIGRDESLKVQLADPRSSRRHFRVAYDEATDGHRLEDMDSKNGTRLNGRRILEPTLLHTADRIGAGDSLLVYLRDDHGSAESALAAAKQLGERDIRTVSDAE